jgi:hypothetical protein
MDADSSIVLDDACVQQIGKAGKKLCDVPPIVTEFQRSMQEYVRCRVNCLIPCNDPFPMGVNNPGRFIQSNNDLEFTDPLELSFVMCDGVLSHEDMVKVNGSPCNEVCPF